MLRYEARANNQDDTQWVVEAIDDADDGAVHVARFTGPLTYRCLGGTEPSSDDAYSAVDAEWDIAT